MISHGKFQPCLRVYSGADISGFIDARGMKYWACTAYPREFDGKVQCCVIFWDNGKSYAVPRNDNGGPLLNARGSFGSCGTKMFYSGWDKTLGDAKAEAFMFELENAVPWR